ncbi:beta-ketoacyl-ACP synthase III [Anatilimnocola sp. NA78]|uniref:beta-ketoacyl-ACP synthase III n=1 Tax=Anatilimnocola sp. NA78 TaxID=3415683 RepID=UPI003CE494E3
MTPSVSRVDPAAVPAVDTASHAETAPHSPVWTLTGVQVLGVGAFVPPKVVRNEDLISLGCDAEWIEQRTGIRERRQAEPQLATSDLAYEAAIKCLEQAGISAKQVDLIVLATMSPDSPAPSTACRLQRLLGCSAPAFDVSAACAGFMYALSTGMQFVKTGNARHVLVVGSDVMTRTVNPADKKTYPLFGDGAGAVLLGAGNPEQGFVAYTLGADGNGVELLHIPAGGSREALTAESIAAGRQYMSMDGRAVFKWAVRTVADSCREVLGHAGLTTSDVTWLVLHQANKRILEAAASDLGMPLDRVIVNLDRYGNTSAGSIPLVLDELSQQGRLNRGDNVLMSGFGAGLAWGTGLFRW